MTTRKESKYDDEETECQFFLKTCKCNNILFHGLDIMVAVLLICDSLVLLANIHSFVGFLLPVYFAVFGCLICTFAIYIPYKWNLYVPFYFTFLGRGISFLLLGSVVLVFEHGFSIATGTFTIIVAFVYFGFFVWTKWFNAYKFGCTQLPPPLAQRDEENKESSPASMENADKVRTQTPESSMDTKEYDRRRPMQTGQALATHIGANGDGQKMEGDKQEYGQDGQEEDGDRLL